MEMMKKFFFSILNRFLVLFDVLNFSTNKNDDYNYERDFLGVADYGKEKEKIFKPVTDRVENGVKEIYNIKMSVYDERVLRRMSYSIENRFWGLFSFILSDGYTMSDGDFFGEPSLIAYLILDNSKRKHIAVVKATVKHFELLSFYTDVKASLWNFRDKELVYTEKTGFTSL